MRYGRQWKWTEIISVALLISTALVVLVACGDGGGGGYAIAALPAGSGWPFGARQSRTADRG